MKNREMASRQHLRERWDDDLKGKSEEMRLEEEDLKTKKERELEVQSKMSQVKTMDK